MTEVFNNETVSVKQVLKGAKDAELAAVVVLGIDQYGDYYIASNLTTPLTKAIISGSFSELDVLTFRS